MSKIFRFGNLCLNVSSMLLLLAVTLAAPVDAIGQTNEANDINLDGEIIDNSNGKPIPYAHIYNKSNGKGTVSNFEGFFSINNNSKEDTLLISFLGYKTQTWQVKDLLPKAKIKLKPQPTALSSIDILGEATFLYELVNKCSKNGSKSSRQARTYLDLESTIEGKTVELLESYYNGKYSSYDLEELQLKNGRLALKPMRDRYFISTESAKAITLMSTTQKSFLFPTSPMQLSKNQLKKKYNLKMIERYLDQSNHTIYRIGFKPSSRMKDYFEGEVWIDSTLLQVVKIEQHTRDANKHPFQPIFGVDTIQSIDIQITKTYRPIEEEMFIQQVDFLYTVYYNPRNANPYVLKTRALLYAFDYDSLYVIPKFKHTDGTYQDYRNISAVPYNDFFWSNNTFQMNRKEKNENYFTKKDNESNNQQLFSTNFYTNNGFFEHPYQIWNGERIVLRSLDNEHTIVRGTSPINMYNLEVQLYMDINELEDSIHVLTATIFDPFKSFFQLEMDQRTTCFVNLYFDLMEIKRRELEAKIKAKGSSVKKIIAIYNRHFEETEAIKEDFMRETERGRNEDKMRKWNNLVFKELRIDNIALFQPFQSGN